MKENRVEEIMEEDSMKGKYLTFNLGEETYGLEIQYVTEIIGMQAITEVPDMPEYLRGIINLRGKIIPVMDMRSRFRKPLQEYHDRTCIIVIELAIDDAGDVSHVSVGLIVDKVAEVLKIPDEDIESPPDGKTGFRNRYLMGIGKIGHDVKLLIDCEKLMSLEALQVVDKMD